LINLNITQLVKKLTNLYNRKFRTIVIPNSLALDAVLYHTNLQTVFLFFDVEYIYGFVMLGGL